MGNLGGPSWVFKVIDPAAELGMQEVCRGRTLTKRRRKGREEAETRRQCTDRIRSGAAWGELPGNAAQQMPRPRAPVIGRMC